MIDVIHTRSDLDQIKKQFANSTTGLVPTMGNLHEGHLSLVEASLKENDLTIITIFVNPKQFGVNEDFNKYPRTLDDDVSKITKLFFEFQKIDQQAKSLIIFAPESEQEIYPNGFSSTISVGDNLKTILCGKFRPTHFDGVTTVVYRLFRITQPTRAYFGQKDYQQCIVIKQMVNDLELNIELNFFPIIRNSEGLALSSRNQYLSDENKTQALYLHNTLLQLKNIIISEKNLSIAIQKCQELLGETLKDERFDYLEILDGDNLSTISPSTNKIAILGVLRLNGTRLLDNEVIELHAR